MSTCDCIASSVVVWSPYYLTGSGPEPADGRVKGCLVRYLHLMSKRPIHAGELLLFSI